MPRTKRLGFVPSLSKAGDCLQECWTLMRAGFPSKARSICFWKCPFPPRVPPLQKVPLLHNQGLGTGNIPELGVSSQSRVASSALWNTAFRWENRRDSVPPAIYISLKSSVLQEHCSPSPPQVTAGKETIEISKKKKIRVQDKLRKRTKACHRAH